MYSQQGASPRSARSSCLADGFFLDKTKRTNTCNSDKMGRKNKNSSVKSKQNVQEKEEFQLNLKSLDGYDLPDSEEKESDAQPKAKKLKQSRSQILGVDYREREEKRLEQLLFGDLVQNFERDSKVDTKEKQRVSIKQKKNKKKSSEKSSREEEALPEDVFGTNLGLSSTVARKAAWVDEDDDDLKQVLNFLTFQNCEILIILILYRLKDVIAKRVRDPNGKKSVSETAYKKILEKNFAAVHGQVTPKWAQLQKTEEKKLKRNKDDEEESDDEDLTKVI